MKKILYSVIIFAIVFLFAGCMKTISVIDSSSQAEIEDYNIYLEADPETGLTRMKAGLKLKPLKYSSEIQLLLDPLFQINQITVNNEEVNYERKENSVAILLKNIADCSDLSIEMIYEGVIPSDNPFFYCRKSEMFLSHRVNWYPILRGRPLWAKAKFSIEVKEKYKAIAQGIKIKETKQNSDKKLYEFETNLIETRYDVFIGEFTILEANCQDLLLQLVVPKEDVELTKEHLVMFERIVNHYTKIIGPLPFKKLAFVSAKEYQSNASGGPLAISRRESFMNMQKKGYYLLAHEIAHAYWGHTVMGIGPDIPLISEAFADYSAYSAIKEIYGQNSYLNFLANAAAQYFKAIENTKINYSVREALEKSDLEANLSSIICNNKGAWLLVMLEEYLGAEQFHEVLRIFVEEYGQSGKYSTYDDFINLAEVVTKEELDWFLNGWYYGFGEPKFSVENVEWKNNDDSFALELKMDSFSEKIQVEIGMVKEGKIEEIRTKWISPGLNMITLEITDMPEQIIIDPYMKILKSPENIDYSGSGSSNKLVISIIK